MPQPNWFWRYKMCIVTFRSDLLSGKQGLTLVADVPHPMLSLFVAFISNCNCILYTYTYKLLVTFSTRPRLWRLQFTLSQFPSREIKLRITNLYVFFVLGIHGGYDKDKHNKRNNTKLHNILKTIITIKHKHKNNNTINL